MTEFPFLHLTIAGVTGFSLTIWVYLSSNLRNLIFPFNVAFFSIVITLTTLSRLLLPFCPQPRLSISTQLALVLGITIFLAGISLIFLALLQLGLPTGIHSPPKKERRLIKEGVYTRLRHPIYMGDFLWCLGLAVIFKAQWALLITPLWLSLLLAVARMEEKLLEREFGEEFQQYKQKVPSFIPRLLKTCSLV